MQGGKYFEEGMKAWLRSQFEDIQNASVTEDRYAGTDLFLCGVPVDITEYPAGKNCYTPLFSVNCGVFQFSAGIRTGNGRVWFDRPVLVLGFELYPAPRRGKEWGKGLVERALREYARNVR